MKKAISVLLVALVIFINATTVAFAANATPNTYKVVGDNLFIVINGEKTFKATVSDREINQYKLALTTDKATFTLPAGLRLDTPNGKYSAGDKVTVKKNEENLIWIIAVKVKAADVHDNHSVPKEVPDFPLDKAKLVTQADSSVVASNVAFGWYRVPANAKIERIDSWDPFCEKTQQSKPGELFWLQESCSLHYEVPAIQVETTITTPKGTPTTGKPAAAEHTPDKSQWKVESGKYWTIVTVWRNEGSDNKEYKLLLAADKSWTFATQSGGKAWYFASEKEAREQYSGNKLPEYKK
jgi:hypothetical protein